MKLAKLLLSLVFVIMLLGSLSAEVFLIRIDKITQSQKSWLDSTGNSDRIVYDIDHTQILASQEILDYLEENGIDYVVLKTGEEIRRSLENYRSYDDTYEELHNYAINYPEITSFYSLGNSTCYEYYLSGNDAYEDFQHEIWCLKVSDNPGQEEDEPNVLICSAIHAREPISLEVVMTFLDELFSSYGTDPEITSFVENNQIWFVPLINPDGHKLVYEELHLMHRKNMRDNNENNLPDYSTVDGVDLNRNFGYVWGPNGTSSNSGSSIYNGPEAWSELEVQYLRDLYRERKFWAGFTYHSQGEWVLYPLGHLPNACSFDHQIMHDLAEDMAATLPRLHNPGNYTPAQAVNFGYTCQGTMGDWSYAEERIFGYTIELADEFIPADPTQCCEDNLEAFRVILNRLNNRVLTGHATDPWGTPLVVEVNVVQIDEQAGMSEVEPYRSGALFGRFWRPLLTGSYEVDFICEGFETVSYQEVQITDEDITELDVIMYPNWWGEHFKGDVDDNGSVDAFDSSILMRYLVGWDPAPYAPLPWEDWRIIISDTTLDGELDSYDCSAILQHVVGIIVEF